MRMHLSLSKLALMLIIVVMIPSYHTFYLTLSTSENSPITKKCYSSTVYKEQRLLIELQLPIIQSSNVQAGIQIATIKPNSNERTVLFNQIINSAIYKKTVEKETHNVQQMGDQTAMEYETCIFLKSKESKEEYKADTQGSAIPTWFSNEQKKQKDKQYFTFSLKLLTNFSHILNEKRSSTPTPVPTHSYTAQNLQELTTQSNKLLAIAKQQINIHRQNQKIQSKTEKHVKDLENSIFSMSITQSALLVFGSLMHINLMRSYLKGSGLL